MTGQHCNALHFSILKVSRYQLPLLFHFGEPVRFQTLFTVLSYPNVCVERFRMFGCPTLDDSVMQVFRTLSD